MIMVDKKILREMSQDVLVIPFTEEMADKLDKFCRIHETNFPLCFFEYPSTRETIN